MIKIKAKTGVIIAAVFITVGSASGITVETAAPAQATSCPYNYGGSIDSLASLSSPRLDDYGGGSGTYVHTYPFTGSNNQLWCLEAAQQGGYYFHPYNNLGLCLDVPHSNYVSGQRIWVYVCNGTTAQRWCWNGDGYIVTAGNAHFALHDWGVYRTVTIENGGNYGWGFDENVYDNC